MEHLFNLIYEADGIESVKFPKITRGRALEIVEAVYLPVGYQPVAVNIWRYGDPDNPEAEVRLERAR